MQPKPPRTWSVFHELPLSAIEPEGWLRAYLENQRDGLTGHLDLCGFPFDSAGWASDRIRTDQGDAWWPYEQTGYWLDGMTRCGHLLRDPDLLAKAGRHLGYVLRHARTDGYLGPELLRQGSRWPHAVFLRALMAQHAATGDARIAEALRRHYLSGTNDHGTGRDVCNVEAMLWAYGRSGDRRLLAKAVTALDSHCRQHPESDAALDTLLSEKRASEHGVTFNEIAKLGAILYSWTGRKRYLEASVNGYRKIDRDQMLIDGICSSSEGLRGKDPLDSHETCDIADYTWSVGYLLQATGATEYADKIERACFNAAPGAVRSDFKALQYFSCPNQVIADASSNHNQYQRGRSWMAYWPNQEVQCCPGEVNRIMPNFAARMWLGDGRGGLVAALYGPCRITAAAGAAATPVTIVEDTTYPFSDTIQFQVRTEKPAAFTLWLRIPGWCRDARVLVNGREQKLEPRPGTFCKLRRTFAHNDRVTLHLPMELKLSEWPGGGIGLERGPLVYALRIQENWQKAVAPGRSCPEFPAWAVTPASPWNYALAVDPQTVNRQVTVHEGPVPLNPWNAETAPIRLQVPARRVARWGLIRKKSIETEVFIGKELGRQTLTGDFAFTPPLPDPATLPERLAANAETVTFIPYGCAKLRLAILPKCP